MLGMGKSQRMQFMMDFAKANGEFVSDEIKSGLRHVTYDVFGKRYLFVSRSATLPHTEDPARVSSAEKQAE